MVPYTNILFIFYKQDSFTGIIKDVKILDDFGLLTCYRDPTDDEIESFESLKELEFSHEPYSTFVHDQVKSASIVTMNRIINEEEASDAIAKCEFLKTVSLDFLVFSQCTVHTESFD